MTDFIDPEELPFTEDELFNAACLFMSSNAARHMARHLADCGPGVIEAREERRAKWQASGIANAHWMPLHALGYPEDLLPALASLSHDAEMRALFLQEERWQSVYRMVVSRMQREALERSGAMPSREEMIRMASAVASTKKDERLLKQGLVVQGPPPSRPTTEMVSAAHAELSAERQRWAANVARFRTRGMETQSGNGV